MRVTDADIDYGLRSGVSIVPEQRDSTVPETNVRVATVASARYSENTHRGCQRPMTGGVRATRA